VSTEKVGSFVIANTGDENFFTDILLLIAIDADNLPDDFNMTINLQGQPPFDVNDTDFVYYDDPYGRPSGFHSVTDPNVEPISYAFDTGMVCIYGVSGLDALEPTVADHPEYENRMTVEYSFDYLPAAVVFSVYGYVAGDQDPTIYHTNRGSMDLNNPTKIVSTFAVTAKGDLDFDLDVDPNDFSIMSMNWYTAGPQGDINDDLDVDETDLAIMADNWLFGK